MSSQRMSHVTKSLSRFRAEASTIAYHLKTLWLFTYSDLKTIVAPCTAFAVLQRLGVSAFVTGRDDLSDLQPMTLNRVTIAIFWTWFTLLKVTVANQRKSIEEDQLNKPWRPLPTGRITSQQATIFLWALYPASVFVGFLCGAHVESIVMVFLSLWYHEFGGAGSSWLIRNFVNACGITCFLSGALSVIFYNIRHDVVASLDFQHLLVQSSPVRMWIVIIWLIIFTGIQIQDMEDQTGDDLIDRKTMPLVLGDYFARWTIALSALFWSWFCPWYWSLGYSSYIVPVALGTYIAWRILSRRAVRDDKLTFRLWNLWLTVFFALPWQAVE